MLFRIAHLFRAHVHRQLFRALVVASVSLLASSGPYCGAATIYADSSADWGASAGIQGYNGWNYGFYAGTSSFPYTNNPAGDDFQLMTQFNPTGSDHQWWHQEGVGGYWTMVGQNVQQPNGTQSIHAGRLPALEDAVRRWVSTVAGYVHITGHISMGGGPQGGNGVMGHVLVNGATIEDLPVQTGDQTGYDFRINTLVTIGQPVDFVIDPGPLAGGAYSDLFDTTKFTVQITNPVPEPSTWVLLIASLPVLWLMGRSTYSIHAS